MGEFIVRGARRRRLREPRHDQRRRRARGRAGALLRHPQRPRHVRGRLPRLPLRRPAHDGRERVERREGLRAHRAARGALRVRRYEDVSDDIALLALQGPTRAAILQPLTEHRSERHRLLPLRRSAPSPACRTSIVSRTGYTGEDGFELYFAERRTPHRSGTRSRAPATSRPCGLGAPRLAAPRDGDGALRQRHRRHRHAARGEPRLDREARKGRLRRARRARQAEGATA